MIDDLMTVLSAENVSVPGVLLAVLVISGIGLWKGWWVPGKVHDKITTDCDSLKATLAAAQAALKDVERDYTSAQVDLARLEERDRLRAGDPPPRRRSRTP
jgi:hypothetical protein